MVQKLLQIKMNLRKRILVTGANGMVGSAIVRILKKKKYKNILTPTRKELNLFDNKKTEKFFKKYKPEYIFAAAARVGGILANSKYPTEFFTENILIQNNTILNAHKIGINNLIFFGSSCIYPKFCKQPIKEKYLLTGKLEKTNEAYALAKISGAKLCEYMNNQFNRNYITLMPTNIYGINDNYDFESSHVLASLIAKIHNAKKNQDKNIRIFGTGKPLREFLFVDDLANACIFLMNKKHTHKIINIGSGEEVSIKKLVGLISNIINYKVDIEYDRDKPDGTPRKLLDSSIIRKLGWTPKVFLNKGLKISYQDYCKKHDVLK